MPKVTFEFEERDQQRRMRMTLVDEASFPAQWHIPYEGIADLVEWFASPPTEGDGLRPNTVYYMCMECDVDDFAKVLVQLGEIANDYAPNQPSITNGVRYIHTEELGG